MVNSFSRVALFVDDFGYRQCKKFLDTKKIACIVVASNRSYYKRIKTLSPKNIPVLIQPNKKNETKYFKFCKEIKRLKIDLIISNSYSMIIGKGILDNVKYAVNIHWALLPRNRGPNPIQWSIIKEEKFTGITIHEIDETLDTGPILYQEKIKIDRCDTWVMLRNKLKFKSKSIFKKCLNRILIKGYIPRVQNEKFATKNTRLTPSTPRICFSMSDIEIYNLIRAQVYPLKGAYLIKDNKKIFFNRFIEIEKIKNLRELYE